MEVARSDTFQLIKTINIRFKQRFDKGSFAETRNAYFSSRKLNAAQVSLGRIYF